MNNDRAQPIVRTLFGHIESGQPWLTEPSSANAADYVDPDHAALERERLFDRLPQVVALTADVPTPGSFVRRDQFGYSVVISRGVDGIVRTLANVCAHRGAEVVREDRGCQHRHACPYHAWTYDQSGTLVGVPNRSSFPSVEVPGPGLTELPTVEDRGLIWAASQGDHKNLLSVPSLGAIADDLDSLVLDEQQHWRTHRFDLNLNWKLVIDTFLEPYHFASLHRDTVGPIFFPNLCFADRHGPHVREVIPRRSLLKLADQPPETWDIVPHSALVYVLFPSTVLVMQIDHVETWRIWPHPDGDPRRSICELDFYVPPGPISEAAQEHWEKNWRLTIDTVEREDFNAMAGVQRGLGSGAINQLRFGANEPALSMFHQSLSETLNAGAEAGV